MRIDYPEGSSSVGRFRSPRAKLVGSRVPQDGYRAEVTPPFADRTWRHSLPLHPEHFHSV